ncbi:hypothetical protein D3C85_932330 [compost metagenome]
MMHGKPSFSRTALASSMLWAIPERGHARPMDFIALSKRERSSALSMVSALAPIISTPNFSRTPSRSRSRAQFRAVWPPMVGSSASGRSFSMILATVCHLIGSM